MCDGDISPGSATGSYATYVTNRMEEPSPLIIDLYRNYDESSGEGQVHARVCNETGQAVEGNIYFVLTETGIS